MKSEVICERESKKNCEETKEREDYLDDLVEKQEKIIKEAESQGINEKEIRRLEENLKDLEETLNKIEDYLEECKDFLEKCSRFE